MTLKLNLNFLSTKKPSIKYQINFNYRNEIRMIKTIEK